VAVSGHPVCVVVAGEERVPDVSFPEPRGLKRRSTVLKEAGIVVAAAAAGVLALSPMAFAGDFGASQVTTTITMVAAVTMRAA
jgi:hypothetical protein